MAIDRQGIGLTVLRICLGVFFLSAGLSKLRWFIDWSILAAQFTAWSQTAAAGSVSAWYLQRIAIPGVAMFAMLVPLGEISSGVALIIGF